MNGKESKRIPVTVTVASEQEPTVVDGEYAANESGFTLEFAMGLDKFTVAHNADSTRLNASGVMSYDITLGDSTSHTLLTTPYGMVKFDVVTTERKIGDTANGLRIQLGYVLSATGVGDMARAVDITVEFKK